MTRLRELVARSAAAALTAQRADGTLPAGLGGAAGGAQTPVRNTSHWLVTFCAVAQWGGEERFREAALAAGRWLAGEKARPGGASFLHRLAPPADSPGGLGVQAAGIEALAEAAEAFDAPHLAELAERVFLLHPFDADLGLWRRVGVEGAALGFEPALGAQLAFAAAGAVLAPLAARGVSARVQGFLDQLPRHLALRASGVLRRGLAPAALWRRAPRLALRLGRARLRERAEALPRDVACHAAQLYALALLRRHAPDHPFWRRSAFERLWHFAKGDAHRAALHENPWAWRLHPTGIEMAFALETLEGPGSEPEARSWLGEQLRRHWDARAALLRKDAPDPETLAARLSLAVRLPDLEIP
jgi:hypothetical protein